MAKVTVSLKEVVGKGYADFFRDKHRYRVCKGSRGSKKSKTTALNIITRMMQYPDANTLVIRRTFTTLKDSCYSDLKWAINRLKVDKYWKPTVNPLEIVYIPTGQRIIFRGFDSPLKLTSISVPKGVLCWVWIEEAYEVTDEDAFNKLDMSIRGEMPDGLFKQITLTFNPWSEKHWLKKRFFDTPDDDVFTKTTTYMCNEWLDENDKKIFEKMKINNPKRYHIEGLGEWGIAEGLIYENVELRDFDLDALIANPKNKACYGLDFGYTDPTAFIACIISEDDKSIYIFDEFLKTGLTNARIACVLDDMGYAGEKIICDSAEPKSIRELQELGIRAEPSRKGRDSVTHGIQKIQNYKLIVALKCKETYRALCNYTWEKNAEGKSVDKPEHEWSHLPDALRYGVSKQLLGDTFSFE